ncbi:hypothetical protein C7N43_36090 [Sphingobacteriales bacterium UPWRP_1]|nr:hypothetical protein B6N25_03205 [Sphingobacteriales bacterium TSM_CSS]PSJ72071.1 hypothetical protein C7N43_36090 [Sphingobacteriales bacterium UPWRP_1]
MIQLENLPHHLQTLTVNDWQALFNLLPILEQPQKFSETITVKPNANGVYIMPYIKNAGIVHDFLKVVAELQLAPVFDWTSWSEAATLLNPSLTPDFDHLDTVTLCKLFTVIIRKDRFLEGFLSENFENGNVRAIIRSLQKQIQVKP